MAQLQCIVVTPEATVLDEQVDFVALPLDDGEIGIGPGRAPLIGRLGYGEMRLVTGGHSRRFYVDGGFVQVAENVVSVLTNLARPADQIDKQAASDLLQQALQTKATGDERIAARQRQERQARAQLHVAGGRTASSH